MKKICVVIPIILLLSSCFGCQNKQLTNDTITENVNENNMDEDEQNSNNTDFVLNCDDTITDFTFNTNTIANLSKVTEMFDWSNMRELICDYEVEIQLKDDSVPEEIIEVLISVNDRDDINDELYKNYLSANYICIDLETVTNTELGNSVLYDLIKNRGIIDIKQVDIDYDNEYEYLVEYMEGSDGNAACSVFKNVQEEIKEVYYIFEDYTHYELLELNDRYYILAGDYVVYYNVTTSAWCSVNCERTVTDFKPCEFYSESQIGEDIIFQDIDLVHRGDWEQQDSFAFEFICGNPMVLERQINKEAYYYVCTDFQNHERKNRDDRLLFIVKENEEGDFEIIKAYYLAADFQLVVE